MSIIKKSDHETWKKINDCEGFYKGLLDFANSKNSIPDVLLKEQKDRKLILPIRKFLAPKLPKKSTQSNQYPFSKSKIYISTMDPRF